MQKERRKENAHICHRAHLTQSVFLQGQIKGEDQVAVVLKEIGAFGHELVIPLLWISSSLDVSDKFA